MFCIIRAPSQTQSQRIVIHLARNADKRGGVLMSIILPNLNHSFISPVLVPVPDSGSGSGSGFPCFPYARWIVPLKDKKGETVAEAFKSIFKESRKPQYLWTDKGKEYYNKHVKDLLEKNGIQLYSTENEEKSSVVERWNRTIKSKMWKQFTVQGNTMYLDMLPKLVKQYNNTKHSSIKMTPTEASKKRNEGTVYFNLYGDMETSKQKPKFKIGDKVRISKYKRNVFDKGYTPNWTEEVFTVDKIQYTNPITYKLKDLNDEDIQGSFYEPELLKAKQDVFRIDKVIRRDHKKKQALVKWKGYSDDFNSWIPMKDLTTL